MSSYPLFFLLLLAVAACAQVVSVRRNQKLLQSVDDLRFLPPRAARASQDSHDPNSFELLDVVVLASVDGRFHALERKSGKKLWSMSGPVDANLPSYLNPLVSTEHPDFDPDVDDPPETYIIEPQSGDIYVTSGPSDALQRLPFSMPQLVEMSPFSFGEADRRTFVGKKKTSLLVIELQSGRVKAALDSECPWEESPFEDFVDGDEIDLDELDGTKEPKEFPIEIQVGRSDYTLSIHSRRFSANSPRIPRQNLSFATYGPNNQDQEVQMAYRRTPDDMYIEPLPNGEVIAFKIQSPEERSLNSAPKTDFLWGQRFSSPIVAVFDVVQSEQRPAPFVLLQPRPRLDDALSFFELTSAAKRKSIDASSAYVGIVEETGSLYALSPDHYSLVIFGNGHAHKSIDPPPGSMPPSTPEIIDMEEFCRYAANDRRCATGLRQLREDSRSRLARLLDGAPASLPSLITDPGPRTNSQESITTQPIDNSSLSKIWPPFLVPSSPGVLIGESANVWSASGVLALLACTMFGLGSLWASRRRSVPHLTHAASTSASIPASASASSDIRSSSSDPSLPLLESRSRADGTVSTSSSSSPPTPPTPAVTLPSTPEKMRSVPSGDLSPASAPEQDDPEIGEESEKDGEVPVLGKKKGTRRKRGKRRKNTAKDAPADTEAEGDDGAFVVAVPPAAPSIVVPQTPASPAAPSLIVSDNVLGFGSHGTVVYQGSLQGRAVAVKRLLNDFTTLALREVSLLQDADDHPNVIRYYYQESHANFLYIALELCPASLADVIERPNQFPELSAAFVAKRALREITSGLRHLHGLKIVHRDIKPQNILVADSKKGHRMLISDFGLCRKLELDQTSFLPTAGGAMGVGTFGWRAPEILRGDVKLDDAPTDESSMSSRGSTSTATSTGTTTASTKKLTRLTKSVDIFALGCLFYYCLTSGDHPFGDRFEREVNILKNAQNLSGLEVFGEEGAEAMDLISKMLAPEASDRPDTTTCLMHPYFWDASRRLGFLQDASDRFENMCRDPKDAHLVALETGAYDVVGNDWVARLDRLFVDNLGKFRKYDGKSVQDLLRALRNKRHHYQDLPDNVKRHVGSMPEGFLLYFTRRYPKLFLHVHRVIADSTLRTESMFRSYFSVPD